MTTVNGIRGKWQVRDKVEPGETFRVTGPWKADFTLYHDKHYNDYYFHVEDVIEVFVPDDTLAEYGFGTVLIGDKSQRAIVRSTQGWHWADDYTDTLSDTQVLTYLGDGFSYVPAPVGTHHPE